MWNLGRTERVHVREAVSTLFRAAGSSFPPEKQVGMNGGVVALIHNSFPEFALGWHSCMLNFLRSLS